MADIDSSRRAFLRGRTRIDAARIQLPWQAGDFLQRCSRCDDCIAACPEGILVKGDGSFPTVDFRRGECSFCRACVDACKSGALDTGGAQPWTLKAVIADRCLAMRGIVCRSCADYCAARAIGFSPRPGGRLAPAIDAARCTGCGACVAACPELAIAVRPGEDG